MQNQKLETVLKLALETGEGERARTEDLNVGFDEETRSWELIVKYHGSLDALAGMGVTVERLIAGYAILTVPEKMVDAVAELEQIEYLEKPKRYYYELDPGDARGARNLTEGYGPAENGCFGNASFGETDLTGEGVLIAVLDSGIDWKRREFRKVDGSTRIACLWDQTLEGGQAPEGFHVGREFTAAQINEALKVTDPQEQFMALPSLDASGHGTAVAGIAAGNLPETGYRGAAPGAELLVVKLGRQDEKGFPGTTQIMRAVTWALRKAEELGKPLAVNLSFGNSYGAHDGSSLLERFLDNAAQIGRTVLCVGSGNEGSSNGHVGGNVYGGGNEYVGRSFYGNQREAPAGAADGRGTARRTYVELAVAEYERSLRVQFWQNYSDVYRVFLRSPGGGESELTAPIGGGKFTLTLQQTKVLAYQGEPSPYTAAKEIYLEMLPVAGPYINTGIWTFVIEPVRVVTGQFYFYLSDSAVRNGRTGFAAPTPQVTMTIPSAAAGVITVGAYDPTYEAYADFSGRGYAEAFQDVGVVAGSLVKPDLAAAGVNIIAPDIYGSYRAMTGTSFATPIVTGAAALLMQYGIVRGRDPFLYGEKVKAYLRAGARPLRGEERYPNDKVGFGALCVRDSLPV